MKLDFSEVQDNKVMPEGDTELTITGAKETKSKNGNNMVVVDFKDADGSFTRDNIVTEGAGAFKFKQFLKALGISEEDAATMEASDLVGNTINATIVHEEYNGEQRAKVKKYNA